MEVNGRKVINEFRKEENEASLDAILDIMAGSIANNIIKNEKAKKVQTA